MAIRIIRLLLSPFLMTRAVLAQPAPAPAADSRQIVAEIDRVMSDAAAKGFGGAIIVEQGGKSLLSKGYGFADRALYAAVAILWLVPDRRFERRLHQSGTHPT